MAAILNAADRIYHSGVVGYGIYSMKETHIPLPLVVKVIVDKNNKHIVHKLMSPMSPLLIGMFIYGMTRKLGA